MVFCLVCLSASLVWLGYVAATPAPTLPSIIEPGSMTDVCNYLVYVDSLNNYMAKNCHTGGNDCGPSSDAGAVSQCAINKLVFEPHASNGALGTLFFGFGMFNFTTTVNVTQTGTVNVFGLGRQNTQLYLATGSGPHDMFNFNPSGITNLYTFKDFKAMGDGVTTGTSYCFFFGANTSEINFISVEIRDCHTANIFDVQTQDVGFNTFVDSWSLGTGTIAGQFCFYSETAIWKIIGSTFTKCGGSSSGAALEINVGGGRSGKWVINGNIFIDNVLSIDWPSTVEADAAITGNQFSGTLSSKNTSNNVSFTCGLGTCSNILFSGNDFLNTGITMAGSTAGFSIQSNNFYWGSTTGTQVKFSDRVSPVNYAALIANNIFRGSASNVRGVYIGNNVDGIAVLANQFYGGMTTIVYGTTTAITSTIIEANKGYNPVGKTTNFVLGSTFAVYGTGSTVVASTDYTIQTTDVLITSTGGTGVSITIKDNLGNTIQSGLATLTAIQLVQGYKVNFGAFSGAPTVTVWWN